MAAMLGVLGMSAGPAVAAATQPRTPPPQTGPPSRLPSSAPRGKNLPVLGQNADPAQPALAAALARARSTGRPTTVDGLTTATSSSTISPSGVVTVRSYVLPVRVRQGGAWVPVNTSLHAVGGQLVPAAIPGDAVSFSAGGAGPMATISSGGPEVSLWWAGRLPVPVVSGSSATYRNVMPSATTSPAPGRQPARAICAGAAIT